MLSGWPPFYDSLLNILWILGYFTWAEWILFLLHWEISRKAETIYVCIALGCVDLFDFAILAFALCIPFCFGLFVSLWIGDG